MDFRRPGRPLVFGPDILNHAVVGLRPGLKQSNPWPGSEGKRAPCIRSTSLRRPSPERGRPPGRLLVCCLCLFGLCVRSKAVLNNLPNERFSIASSEARGNLDCNTDQGHAER